MTLTMAAAFKTVAFSTVRRKNSIMSAMRASSVLSIKGDERACQRPPRRTMTVLTRSFFSSSSSSSSLSTKDPSLIQPTPPPRHPYDVRIVEVGPRDGLQNEATPITVDNKLELIRRLELSGSFSSIEVGAFVSPKWVPQMADTDKVLEGLRAVRNQRTKMNGKDNPPQTRYSVLVPNLRGLEMVISANNSHDDEDNDGNGGSGNNRIVDEVAIFGAASEEFSRRNINATIDESMDRFKAVTERAHQEGIPVRGYVSTVIACPYEGNVPPVQVARVVNQMFELGCYEVSLGDTIGVGTPLSTAAMLKEVLTVADPSQLAMHCHDTFQRALLNITVGLDNGIYTIDASVAGLGGCPYAKGATGNVATEDVVDMLHGMGLSTGIDLDRLIDTGEFICNILNRETGSLVARSKIVKP